MRKLVNGLNLIGRGFNGLKYARTYRNKNETSLPNDILQSEGNIYTKEDRGYEQRDVQSEIWKLYKYSTTYWLIAMIRHRTRRRTRTLSEWSLTPPQTFCKMAAERHSFSLITSSFSLHVRLPTVVSWHKWAGAELTPNTRSTLSKRTTRTRGRRSPGAFPNLVRNTRRRASIVGTRSRSSRRTIPSGVRHVHPACASSFSSLSTVLCPSRECEHRLQLLRSSDSFLQRTPPKRFASRLLCRLILSFILTEAEATSKKKARETIGSTLTEASP